jgi:hypothetical protein
MAFPANSSLFAANLLYQFNSPATTVFDTDVHVFKCGLHTDTGAICDPFSSSPVGYATTGDITGQTGYTGAKNLESGGSTGVPSFALVGGGTAAVVLRFGAYETTWAATTNFSSVQGAIIYDDTIAGATPAVDACLVAIRFGTVGTSGGGSFTVGWSGSAAATIGTIFTIDPNPSA